MKALLDGRILEAEAGAAWAIRTGVAPFVLYLEVDAEAGLAQVEAAQPFGSSLVLDGSDAQLPTLTVERLTILGQTPPTRNPHTRTIVVADARWAWDRRHVRRSYNMRRRTGNRVRRSSGGPLAVEPVRDELAYRGWSLRDGEPWTAAEVVADVLDRVAGEELWREQDDVLSLELPDVEELSVDAPGAAAVAQVLAYLGGRVGIYLDLDGVAVLYDTQDPEPGDGSRRTRARDDPSGPLLFRYRPLENGPTPAEQRRAIERPERVRVLFDPLTEVRIDLGRESRAPTQTLARDQNEAEPALADNVLPLPEDAEIDGRQLLVGTWVRVEDYLDFLQGEQDGGLPNLTEEILRKGWLSGMLEAYGVSFRDPSGLWARRIATIRAHWRTTWRLRDPWASRIRGLQTYLVGTIDHQFGTRAPSPVYQDYAEWINWRTVGGESALDQPERRHIVANRFAVGSGPGGIWAARLADLSQAPAKLTVVDADQKILKIAFELDWTGEATRQVPSSIRNDRIPTADADQAISWLQWGHLSVTHEVSVLVAGVPATPATEAGLYAVELGPEDLPVEVGESRGPPLDVRIPASTLTARFAWDDDRRQDIEALYAGVGALDFDAAYGAPVNEELVREVAIAAATRVYQPLADGVEGGVTTGLTDVKPRGRVDEIRHEASISGLVTTISAATSPPQVSLAAQLPRGVRRLVEGFVDL